MRRHEHLLHNPNHLLCTALVLGPCIYSTAVYPGVRTLHLAVAFQRHTGLSEMKPWIIRQDTNPHVPSSDRACKTQTRELILTQTSAERWKNQPPHINSKTTLKQYTKHPAYDKMLSIDYTTTSYTPGAPNSPSKGGRGYKDASRLIR